MAEINTLDDEKNIFIREDTPEPEEYNDLFDPFDVVAISGSYLGQQTHLNTIKQIQITNDTEMMNNNTNKDTFIHKSTIHIQAFNEFQATKYKKLNKSLISSHSKAKKAKVNIANFWDRQYSSFCIAKNVSYSAIKNYSYSMINSKRKEVDDDKTDNNNENKKCDILIQCGGCYAVKPSKISSLCGGYILNHDLEINAFKLPSLEIARSNCSSIYHDKIGVICFGGRSRNKSILNCFEVLNINDNDIEWNTNYIPSTNSARSRHPSVGFYDDILFVCGGRGVVALNTAECINLNENKKWNEISPMNYSRSFASNIINCKKNGSVIVMGGYGSFHAEFYAEQYDLNKNKWSAFPKSNFSHKYNPYIKLNNELLVVLCDKRTKYNLGIIEILDIRTNKWMKCKICMDDLLQFDTKQELRRLLYI